jgi:hypothetical protein
MLRCNIALSQESLRFWLFFGRSYGIARKEPWEKTIRNRTYAILPFGAGRGG